jgi:hypothetical protein
MPKDAALAAVAKAIALKLPMQAAAILAQTQLAGVSVHDFDSHWSGDNDVQRTTIAAGLGALLRRRKAGLADLATREVLYAIAPSVRKRGPAAFARALDKLLKDPPSGLQAHERRRKPKLDHEKRAQRAITHRIQPLLPYAQFVSEMVTSARPSAVFQDAMDRLMADTAKASDYPYRDGKDFLARTAFQVVFRVADAIGAVDRASADRLATWLPSAPGMFAATLSHIVLRLSRNPAAQDATIKLASHVATLIATDTDSLPASKLMARSPVVCGASHATRRRRIFTAASTSPMRSGPTISTEPTAY